MLLCGVAGVGKSTLIKRALAGPKVGGNLEEEEEGLLVFFFFFLSHNYTSCGIFHIFPGAFF